MGNSDWRPPVQARIRNAAGVEYIVTAHHVRRDLGEFIVARRRVPGGFEARPITSHDWTQAAFFVVETHASRDSVLRSMPRDG